MKTKAAIRHAAGKPLEIVTVDLEGPRVGEVLVEMHSGESIRSVAIY
jgi:S-(hydroxymethyl)glutathione dehydrogenase/alcohol dehydrogenase